MPDHESDLDASSSRGSAWRNEAMIATYEAALSVASHLELADVLQRIADLSRQIVPAKYSALGVADAHGRIIDFFTSGITPEERARVEAYLASLSGRAAAANPLQEQQKQHQAEAQPPRNSTQHKTHQTTSIHQRSDSSKD